MGTLPSWAASIGRCPPPTCSAVLFDIDGTLVDTNYLHVDAWLRAFADVGRPVDAWRIHAAIGMDSAKLLETLLGEDVERLGDAAKERHGIHYAADEERIRAFADARRRCCDELDRRGLKVVLATSSPPEEFAMTTTRARRRGRGDDRDDLVGRRDGEAGARRGAGRAGEGGRRRPTTP